MKAQISYEYYFSLVLFVIFVLYVVFYVISTVPSYTREIKSQLLMSEAYQISELLVNDPGEPYSWATQTSSWWNSDWQYRRAITINNTLNTNSLTDYQVLAILDTASLVSAGKMQSDCSDIRFIDSDGTLISYWLESGCDSASTKVWVKVPSIPASSTKVIYVYYGNPTATSQSSTTNTFIREIDGAQPVKGAWTFDEGSGTIAYDYSGNENNGTLYNGTTVCSGGDCPNWVDGKYGKALSFDGVDDYVEVASPTQYGPEWTACSWVYLRQNLATQAHVFLDDSTWPSTSGHYSIRFSMHNNAQVGFTHYTIEDYYFSYILPTLEWKFVCFVGNTSGTHLYIDGQFIETNPNTINLPVKWIGHSPLRSFPHGTNGTIDEVRIYNQALIADEITDLYNNYGYVTPAYPGRELIRKFSSPEPTTSIGAEEIKPTGEVKRIGLSDQTRNMTNLISSAKINEMGDICSTNYDSVLAELGISPNYQLNISIVDLTSDAVLVNCYPPVMVSRGAVARATRIAATDTGSYVEITVSLW